MMSQMMKAAVFLCCMRSADFCRNGNECLLKIVQKYDSQIIKNVIKYKKYDKRLTCSAEIFCGVLPNMSRQYTDDELGMNGGL